jgi:hypothetical protein
METRARRPLSAIKCSACRISERPPGLNHGLSKSIQPKRPGLIRQRTHPEVGKTGPGCVEVQERQTFGSNGREPVSSRTLRPSSADGGVETPDPWTEPRS